MKTTIRVVSFVAMAIAVIWLIVLDWSHPSMTRKELLLNFPMTFVIGSLVFLAGTFGLQFAEGIDSDTSL